MDDYDGLYPWAVDISDKYCPAIWAGYPSWQALIAQMPLINLVLDPYVKSTEIWHCPDDKGFTILDDNGFPMNATPTCFVAFGTSYLYRTELTFDLATQESLKDPAGINVMADACGAWHGDSTYTGSRHNVLYGDGHVKTANIAQYNYAWYQVSVF
jgi:prepilin-type processing-associated H-X9-DG protein